MVASLSLFESEGDEAVPDGAGSCATLGMVDSLPARLIKPALAVQPRCGVCDEPRLPAPHLVRIAADAGQQLGRGGVLQGGAVGALCCPLGLLDRDGGPPFGEGGLDVRFRGRRSHLFAPQVER
ncbi:hypothetical protein AEJ54_23220 [Azospirillum sp. Sp 7]|nr:hypothetical protein AEJ54_23220 [Azospirillum sp. Sp 7]